MLSTISSSSDKIEIPNASIVDYVADKQGRLIFSVSNLSLHTSDMIKNKRVAVLIVEDKILVHIYINNKLQLHSN